MMPAPPQPGDDRRLIAIDILRGFAILWVLLFHLWADFEIFAFGPRFYYEQLGDRIGKADASAVTAFTDVFFRIGFQGVPLFMMLSGFSLTLSALRSGEAPSPLTFFWRRARRIMPPYWFGFAYTMLVIAGVAIVQSWLHGRGFAYQIQHGVTFGRYVPVPIDWGYVLAGAAMLPRVAQEKWIYAPEAVLWFVPLLLQYYLLFPFLLRALRAFGPWILIAASAAITIGSQALVLRLWDGYTNPNQYGWVLAPTRLVEFALGMALAWVFVYRRELLERAVRTPVQTLALIGTALAVHTFGSMLTELDEYRYTVASTLIVGSLTVACVPMLAARPARWMGAAPVTLLAGIGATSYMVLIVNEPFRYVLSLMRNELPGAIWWPALVVLYVPVSVIAARPLSVLFGLVPRRSAVASQSSDVPPIEGGAAVANA